MVKLSDQLLQQKRKQQVPAISKEALYQLWWSEECTDEKIANLYDVSKKKITNLRHKWGIKLPEVIVAELESKFAGELLYEDDSPTTDVLSRDAAHLLNRIKGLNDIELETLRTELASRFSAFSDLRQEVEFFQTLELALRQFREIEPK